MYFCVSGPAEYCIGVGSACSSVGPGTDVSERVFIITWEKAERRDKTAAGQTGPVC